MHSFFSFVIIIATSLIFVHCRDDECCLAIEEYIKAKQNASFQDRITECGCVEPVAKSINDCWSFSAYAISHGYFRVLEDKTFAKYFIVDGVQVIKALMEEIPQVAQEVRLKWLFYTLFEYFNYLFRDLRSGDFIGTFNDFHTYLSQLDMNDLYLDITSRCVESGSVNCSIAFLRLILMLKAENENLATLPWTESPWSHNNDAPNNEVLSNLIHFCNGKSSVPRTPKSLDQPNVINHPQISSIPFSKSASNSHSRTASSSSSILSVSRSSSPGLQGNKGNITPRKSKNDFNAYPTPSSSNSPYRGSDGTLQFSVASAGHESDSLGDETLVQAEARCSLDRKKLIEHLQLEQIYNIVNTVIERKGYLYLEIISTLLLKKDTLNDLMKTHSNNPKAFSIMKEALHHNSYSRWDLDSGYNNLHLAVINNQFERVVDYVDGGLINIDSVSMIQTGRVTALLLAADLHRNRIFDYLISRGADMTKKDIHGAGLANYMVGSGMGIGYMLRDNEVMRNLDVCSMVDNDFWAMSLLSGIPCFQLLYSKCNFPIPPLDMRKIVDILMRVKFDNEVILKFLGGTFFIKSPNDWITAFSELPGKIFSDIARQLHFEHLLDRKLANEIAREKDSLQSVHCHNNSHPFYPLICGSDDSMIILSSESFLQSPCPHTEYNLFELSIIFQSISTMKDIVNKLPVNKSISTFYGNNGSGYSLMTLAISTGNHEIVEYLISLGVFPTVDEIVMSFTIDNILPTLLSTPKHYMGHDGQPIIHRQVLLHAKEYFEMKGTYVAFIEHVTFPMLEEFLGSAEKAFFEYPVLASLLDSVQFHWDFWPVEQFLRYDHDEKFASFICLVFLLHNGPVSYASDSRVCHSSTHFVEPFANDVSLYKLRYLKLRYLLTLNSELSVDRGFLDGALDDFVNELQPWSEVERIPIVFQNQHFPVSPSPDNIIDPFENIWFQFTILAQSLFKITRSEYFVRQSSTTLGTTSAPALGTNLAPMNPPAPSKHEISPHGEYNAYFLNNPILTDGDHEPRVKGRKRYRTGTSSADVSEIEDAKSPISPKENSMKKKSSKRLKRKSKDGTKKNKTNIKATETILQTPTEPEPPRPNTLVNNNKTASSSSSVEDKDKKVVLGSVSDEKAHLPPKVKDHKENEWTVEKYLKIIIPSAIGLSLFLYVGYVIYRMYHKVSVIAYAREMVASYFDVQ